MQVQPSPLRKPLRKSRCPGAAFSRITFKVVAVVPGFTSQHYLLLFHTPAPSFVHSLRVASPSL